MRIAICDDNADFRAELNRLINNYYMQRNVLVDISLFECAETLLNSEDTFDIVFLDVEMNSLDGIHAAIIIKEKQPNTVIIIITSYMNYLDDAFRINAFRFLTKPVDKTRLYTTLDDLSEYMSKEDFIIYDLNTKQDVRLFVNEIIFLETQGKNVRFIASTGEYLSRGRISHWKYLLDYRSFVCPHSSYIVNLNYSILHTRTCLTLAKRASDNSIIQKYEISIAPLRQREIRDAFLSFTERRIK